MATTTTMKLILRCSVGSGKWCLAEEALTTTTSARDLADGHPPECMALGPASEAFFHGLDERQQDYICRREEREKRRLLAEVFRREAARQDPPHFAHHNTAKRAD